jgi:hypothetical protein
VWMPINFTAYATDIRDTRVGMWALDSEDADIVGMVSHFQSDSPTSRQEGELPGTRLAQQNIAIVCGTPGNGMSIIALSSLP